MKSVADLIANKNALIKRDNRGKITAASLSAAGVAVLAAAQAEAQGVDGFEDITSSVTSFERIGNGQVEFELENGQRFIANEGQYIIEGNQISVSQELVTIVGGAGINPTVIAVGVAGAALLVGALILLNSDDSSDSTATTTGSTTTTTTPTFTVTSDAATTATGTTGDDTFTVTNQTYSPGLTVDGDDGSDEVTLSGAATTAAGIDLSSQNIQLTDVESLVVSANGGAATTDTTTVNIAGEVSSLTVEVTGDGQIDVDNLGTAAATAASVYFNNLDAAQEGDVEFSNSVVKGTVGLQSAGTAGSGSAKLTVAGAAITELTIASNTSANKLEFDSLAAAITTLKISGDADFDIATANTVGVAPINNIDTIDASTASGDLTFKFNPTATTDITLGSGNDTVTATTDLAGGTLDGGLGGDTLILNDVSVSGGTITDIETVNLTATGTESIDYAAFDGDLLDLNIDASATSFNVEIKDFDSGGIDIASTVASLSFAGTAGASSVDIDAPSATTLALAASGGALQTSFDVDFEGVGASATIDVDAGVESLTLRANASTAVTVDASDASALTSIRLTSVNSNPNVTATASDVANYDGSSQTDTVSLKLAAGADIDLGAGDDQLTVTSVTGASAVISGDAGIDTIVLPSDGLVEIIEISSLSDLGTLRTVALDGSSLTNEVITNFDSGSDLIDLVGGLPSDIEVQTTTTPNSTDFATAYAMLDATGTDVVIVDDTDVSDTDYMLIGNSDGYYILEFSDGTNSTGTASTTVDHYFM